MKLRIAFVTAATLAFWNCPPTDPAAVLLLSSKSASFSGLAGGADPAPATIALANGGGGSLSGLATTVTYASGQPNGWLHATLSATSAPATLTVRPTPSTLTPGAYTATISVTSARSPDAPVTVQVTLNLTAGGTTALSNTTVSFAGTQGASEPPGVSVAITNNGVGVLHGLVATVTYPAGSATGWLTATLNGTRAPASLELAVASGALAPGAHTATVNVTSPYAANGAQTITVSYQLVAGHVDLVVTTPDTLILPATIQAGQSLDLPTWTVTNVGTLTSASVRVGVYLSSDSIFSASDHQFVGIQTQSLAPGVGRGSPARSVGIPNALAAGEYWIGVVADVMQQAAESDETNNVKRTRITVTPAPEIAVTPDEVSFEMLVGGGVPDLQTVLVTNVGGGVLEQLTVAVAAEGWLGAELDRTTAPATLTLRVKADTLAPGATYQGQVYLSSPIASNGKAINVAVTVSAPIADLAILENAELLVTPSTVEAGRNITLPPWTVHNRGTASVDVFRMGVYLSVDEGLDEFDVELIGTSPVITGPGDAAGFTSQMVTIPRGAAGEYWVVFAADRSNQVAESDETNNSRRTRLTVTPAPEIRLDGGAITFRHVKGGVLPPHVQIGITNSGGGTLGYLAWGVEFAPGQPANWLAGLLESTQAPTVLTLGPHISAADLAPGTYTARVQITAIDAGISEFIDVTLVVQPAIRLSSQFVQLKAHVDDEGDSHSVMVTSVYGEALSELSVATTYAATQLEGWLTATLSSTTAPATLELRALTAGLPVGEYSAEVEVASPQAGNGPLRVSVQFKVEPPRPAIALDPETLNLRVLAGTVTPTVATVAVTRVGGGAIDDLVIASINYGIGQPQGWLTASLDRTTTPATLTLQATTEHLEPRGYSASVVIAAAAGVISRSVGIGLNVGRAIALDRATVAFDATEGGPDPAAITVAISGVAGGVVNNLTTQISYVSGVATGWLEATLDASQTPTSLRLIAHTAVVPSGTHSALVTLFGNADNSPQIVTVTFTVRAPLPDLVVTPAGGVLTATPASVSQGSTTVLGGFTVSNTGALASGAFELGLYLSSDAVITTADLRIVSVPHPGLAAGASQDFSAGSVTIPTTVSAGSYHIGVLVDGPGVVGESNESNNSAQTGLAVTPAPVPPNAPSGLVVTPVSGSRIDLRWTDNSTTELGFRVERCVGTGLTCIDFGGNPADFVLLTTVGADVTTYSNTGLTPGSMYHYRVRAYNTAGSSGYTSGSGTATVAAPSDLAATATSATAVSLVWTDNALEETSFQVWRCVGAGCTAFVQIATLGANSTQFQDGGLGEATPHSYRVRAIAGSSTSPFSATVTVTTLNATTLPAAPSGLSASVISGNRIDLMWVDNASNESGFRIERCQNVGCASWSEVALIGANATAHQDSGLVGNTTYRYRARAWNSVGNSSYSTPVLATTLPVPAAPSGLVATPLSSNEVRLTWIDNATNETEYEIQRCLGSGCTSFTRYTTVSANTTTYTLGASLSSTYRFRVRAASANGSSAFSNEAQATTPPLEAPSNLVATVNTSGRITLTWTNNAPVTILSGVEIQRCAGAGCTNFATIIEVDENVASYSNTGLTPLTSYSYRVRATYSVDNSQFSSTATGVTPTAPAAPTNLLSNVVTSSSASLTWVDHAIAGTRTQIERCSGDGCSNFTAVSSTVLSAAEAYTNTGLQGATTYRYRIRATDGDNHSSYTNIITVTTQPAVGAPAAPSGLTANAVSSSLINLFWTDNATNETGYQVERCTGASCTNFAVVINASVANVTGYQSSGLAPATTYRFRVRFFNAAGNSLYSNVVTLTTLAGATP